MSSIKPYRTTGSRLITLAILILIAPVVGAERDRWSVGADTTQQSTSTAEDHIKKSRAASRLKFKPAAKDGMPLPFWQRVMIEFHLN